MIIDWPILGITVVIELGLYVFTQYHDLQSSQYN